MARRTAYTVTYNSEDHIGVLTQMWGSTWPKVLPYCLFNVFLMCLLTYISNHFNGAYSIKVTTQGHSFIALVVAFLLVSRVSIAYGRYNQARNGLEAMCRYSRELVHNACTLTGNSTDKASAAWRAELAYRSLILLRTAMAVVDYPVTNVPAWEVPELSGVELEDVKRSTYLNPETRRWAHADRSNAEESMRVPIRLSYLLRKTIHSHAKRVKFPVQPVHETIMLGNVDGFLAGYYAIRLFMTTPVPFPLIQMARTLVLLYVFTVPFVLLADQSSLFAHCFTIFLLTYGFVGLEFVAIEMDDPFGDDPNDFDNLAMAVVAYEDTYLTILDVDGPESADDLRFRMHDKSSEPLLSEQSWLLSRMA